MKYSLFFLFSLLFISATSIAQREYEYINPPQVQHQDYSLSLDHIISKEDYCKFRLTIVNNTDHYQAFDLSKVGFVYDGIGTYYPKKGKLKIIPPNDKIAETVRIDGNMNYMVEQFTVLLEGFNYATNATPLNIPSDQLQEKAVTRSDYIQLETKKAYSKRGRFFFSINSKYSAKRNEFATINPSQLLATNEAGDNFSPNLISKKFFIVQNGKKAVFNGDFETKDVPLTLDWSKVFTNYQLVTQPTIRIPIYHTMPRSNPPVAARSNNNTTTTRTTQTTRITTTNTNTVQKDMDDMHKEINDMHAEINKTHKEIKSNTATNFVSNQCGKHVGDVSSYPVKITFFSEEGECFKIRSLGETINNQFSSKVVFSVPTIGKVTIMMQNGESFKKSLLLSEETFEATYKIKRNKKGKLVAKLLLGTVKHTGPTAQELADQSATNLKNFQEEHQRKMDAINAKTASIHNNNSNSTSSSSTRNNNTTSSRSNNNNSNSSNRSSSSNNTTSRHPSNSMHLTFYNGSQPLANMRVEVSTMSGVIGRGTTDSKGNVYIDASQLGSTRRINVYAKNSEVEYKLANVIKLDSNLYAFIEPAKVLLETTGNLIKAAEDGDTDQIIKDFGF